MVTLSRVKRPSSSYDTAPMRGLLAALLLWIAPHFGWAASEPTPATETPHQAAIRLTDGSVIMGAVSGLRDDVLTVKTRFSQHDLAIDVTHIDSLRWLVETELLLDDDRVVVLPELTVAGGKLDLGESTVPLAAVAIMNPADWEEGVGYHWTGDTSTAIAFSRGNTETDEFDAKVNTVLKSTRDRYTFNGQYERDDAYNLSVVDGREVKQKVVTADNWKLLAKYDYFLEGTRNYVGVNGSLEADALAGVDLRTYVGPYVGRKLLDDAWLKLDGELGLAFVATEYDPAVDQQDNDYTGVNWNLTGESNILGGDSRLYLRHVGIVDAADTDQLILKNTLGLAFPLLYGLEAAAEMTVNYDGTAAADREKVDEVYSFRVGYAW